MYEMQLMPPVLYFLQQAYKDLPPSAYGPNDWEWSTLVVYSCAQVSYVIPVDTDFLMEDNMHRLHPNDLGFAHKF